MEYKERIERTISCNDCDAIPKLTESGMVVDGNPPVQIMHNGMKIIKGAYHGDWMTEIIRSLRGHHEPQEEKAFYEVLQTLPEAATMIELGSFWAYYSMWFQKSIKNPINYLIEPNPMKFEVGKRHFSLNKMEGHFVNAFIGKDSTDKAIFTDWDNTQYRIPRIALDDFMEKNDIPFFHIVHADIQGAEYEMLLGSQRSISQKKIAFFFISTHENMHSQCINFLIEHNFVIVASHTIAESVSADGLIVAKAKWFPGPERITISTGEYYSQIEQDKILDQELFERKENGIFVDVGATDGHHFSNTLFFEKWRRWRGICIEPNPIEFEKLKNSSRTCIKENYAISSKEGETDFLAIDGYGKGLSGIISLYDPRHLERIEQELKGRDSTRHVYKVKTVPLQKLLDRHQITYVDYCSIDVEGAEMQVLESIDFGKTEIKCFTIENNYGLERETIFLASKGYRLWKRVGCDDIFVKIDEYDDTLINYDQATASEKKRSSEVIKKKINAHYAAFLPFQEQMAIEMIDPSSVLNYTRFDVPAKVIYAKHRTWGVRSSWPLQIYDEHIRVFNGYDERDGTGKKGLEMFLNAFNAVIDSIRTRGFNSETSVIPISAQGELLEGAHRLAACLVFNKTISGVKFDFKPWVYDYRFFRSKGLSMEAADAIALEYCRLKKNTHLVFLFPSAVGRDDQSLEILRKYCEIVYEKKICLRNDGPLLLMRQIYRDENWLGNYKNNFPGARLKVQECFKSHEPLRLFVVEANNNDALGQAKQEIRSIYGISNHSVHISDTYEELLRIAQLLLNNNGVHFLNNARISHFQQFENNLRSYKKALSGFEDAWFCVGGSAVMSLYGLREARDIDYLHFQEPLRREEGGLVNSHNKEAIHYPLPIEDIIFDHRNHFFYDGVRFASLNVIRQMKRNRGEEKDQKDFLLMDPLIRPEISIIILNYNGLKNIKACIDSIEKNTEETYELIIIDNASTDGSLEYLSSIKNTILIKNKENIGCPPARALALPLAKGNFVVLLDNDTVVTEGWIAKFEAHFKRYPDIGILGPRSNYVSGAQLVQNVPYKDGPGLEAFARKWANDHTGQLIPAHRLVGFCMFMSRAVIEKIGNIDAVFGKFGFEDDDYNWRAIIAGFKTAIANDVFIHHSGGPQGKGDSGYNQQLLDAWEIFKSKWGLPIDLKYGIPYNPLSYLLQVFRKERHFIPIEKPEDARASQKTRTDKMDPLLGEKKSDEMKGNTQASELWGHDTAAREIPSLIHPEYIPDLTSIIILTQNRLDQTKKCVKSIRKHTPETHEIIFVDNGSTDGTVKWLQSQVKENKNCSLIENKENVRLAEGRNQGINLSQGEFILLMDSDVIVSEGWLSGMLGCLNRAPAAGIVGPMTNNISGLQQVMDDSYRSVDYLDKYAEKFKEQYRHRQIPYRNIAGFCMLFKRMLTEKIGLLDERIGAGHFEDEDFCIRASLEDYRNYIAGDVFIHHHGGKGSPGERKILEEKWVLQAHSPLGKKLAVLRTAEIANDLYQQGKLDQAAEALINCIKLTPEAKEIYYKLARMFIESKRYSEALEVVESMPESAREELKGLECAGYAKEGLGLDDEAAAYTDRMLSQNDNYPAALNLKGVLAYKKGEKETAADYFKKAINNDPGYGEAHTNLGVLYWGLDDKDEAFPHLKKGFVLFPTVPDTSSIYYSVVSSLGLFGETEADFREACRLYPNNKNLAFLDIDILIQQGKFDSAMPKIEDALTLFGLDEGILAAALLVREKLGPRAPGKKCSKKATLSVCMIVKNEEEHLVKCLKSVRDVVDEMIVVDTGSTDRTRDLAVVFGAQVFDFEWNDDFSEARNHSLAQATGDWILILDADEVISSLDHKRLLKTIDRGKQRPVAFDIVTRNYLVKSGSAGWTENDGTYPQEEKGIGWYGSNKVRLFRNNSLVRFENPVHELLEASLHKAGIPIEKCTIPIHHYGRLNQDKILAKGRDYFLLGRKKLEDRGGGDYVALRELAVQATEIGKFEEAIELWQQALALRPDDVEALFNLAYDYMQIGKYQEALNVAKRSIELSPGTKDALLNYALCEMLMGNVLKTTALLEESVSSENENPSLMVVLGASYFVSGDTDKGLAIFKKLAKKQINSVAYVNSILEKLVASGQIEYAKRLIDSALSGNIANRATLRLYMTPHLNKIAKQFNAHGKRDEALLILNATIESRLGDQETMSLYDALHHSRSSA